MPSLAETLAEVRRRIPRVGSRSINEEKTDEVEREFRAQPRHLIEAKAIVLEPGRPNLACRGKVVLDLSNADLVVGEYRGTAGERVGLLAGFYGGRQACSPGQLPATQAQRRSRSSILTSVGIALSAKLLRSAIHAIVFSVTVMARILHVVDDDSVAPVGFRR